MKRRLCVALAVAALVPSCGGESPTSPSTTSTPATTTVTYVTTVPVAGSRFYSFTVSADGTVSAMLASVASPTTGAPLGVPIEMSLGTPAGTDCAGEPSVTTDAALGVQLTGSLTAGVHCLRVADAGYLRESARVAVRFSYP